MTITSMKVIIIGSVIALIAAAFSVSSTRSAISHAPKPTYHKDKTQAFLAAHKEAMDIGGNVYTVMGTGSMAPYFPAAKKGEDPMKTVVAYVVAGGTYDQVSKYDICIYTATWSTGIPVIHQAVLLDKGGWVMSGMNNRYSESASRLTKSNFIAKVLSSHIIEQK